MFTPPAKPAIAADGTLRLVSAPDPSREVRAAARACLQWAREGVPFWDMAVAYRHGEAYLPLVEAVFVEAGIPVYLHEGSPLAERPLGRQTLGLLALFDGELSRQSVMDFLTDAKLPEALHEEYGGISASRWDSLSREAGIVKGAEQWQRRLGAVRAPTADGDALPDWVRQRAEDAGRLARFIAELDRRLRERPARATWAEHLDYLQGLLARYVDGRRRGRRRAARPRAVHRARGGGRLRLVPRRRRAGDRDAALRGRDRQPARGVRRARREHRRGQLAGRGSSSRACGSSARPSGRSRRPCARTRSCSTTSARRSRERAPAPLAPRSARGSEEALIFALACEAARERLVVSYARRATGESRPRLPSVFFRELASQLEGERVSADDAPLLQRDDVERIPGDAIGAPIRPGHAHDPAGGQRRRGRARCPSPSATAPTCRRASRGRSRSRRSSARSRRSPARSRRSAHGSPTATRPGTARSDRTRWPRSRR